MANHKSAKKSIRKTITNTAINSSRVSRIRTFVRKVEAAITSGNKNEAMEAFRIAQSELAKGVTKKVLKANTVSRKTSRIAARIKAMA